MSERACAAARPRRPPRVAYGGIHEGKGRISFAQLHAQELAAWYPGEGVLGSYAMMGLMVRVLVRNGGAS
jgi:hypothetical protein